MMLCDLRKIIYWIERYNQTQIINFKVWYKLLLQKIYKKKIFISGPVRKCIMPY